MSDAANRPPSGAPGDAADRPAGSPPAPRSRLALIGLRCVGKTSVGRALAELAGLPFVDLDDAILARARERDLPDAASVGEVLRTLGEPRFRELESACLAEELQRPAPRVLATGGGVVELPANRAALRAAAHVLWLRADVDVLRRRLAADPTSRPSLTGADPAAELAALAKRRDPLYASVAAEYLDTSRASLPDLARTGRAIWTRLEEKAPKTPPDIP